VCDFLQLADAVPKKRGPKTDVLEALLKRVDGLEQRLKEKKSADGASPTTEEIPISAAEEDASAEELAENQSTTPTTDEPKANRHVSHSSDAGTETAVYSPINNEPSPTIQPDALLDTYFSRFHAKPFHILDESTVRQRLQLNQLPTYLVHAISAVAARYVLFSPAATTCNGLTFPRYTPHPSGYQSAIKLSEEHASQARSGIDTDEPSVDALQALLLLVIAFTAGGKGKKAYMLLSTRPYGLSRA
jgi:hypothetical protein